MSARIFRISSLTGISFPRSTTLTRSTSPATPRFRCAPDWLPTACRWDCKSSADRIGRTTSYAPRPPSSAPSAGAITSSPSSFEAGFRGSPLRTVVAGQRSDHRAGRRAASDPCYRFDETVGLLDNAILVIVDGRDVVGIVEPDQFDAARADQAGNRSAVGRRYDVIVVRLQHQGRTFDPVSYTHL